jgi:predicted transcriptional regulator
MAEDQSIDRGELLTLTAAIVAAHVGNNAVAGADLGGLIQSVFETLRGLASVEPAASVELTPAVPIKRSVTDDHIVCLEDGKKLKMLKRHLMTDHGLSPKEYRARWGLRPDYPMVAPNYSAQRQALASRLASAPSRPTAASARAGSETKATAQDRGLISLPAEVAWPLFPSCVALGLRRSHITRSPVATPSWFLSPGCSIDSKERRSGASERLPEALDDRECRPNRLHRRGLRLP